MSADCDPLDSASKLHCELVGGVFQVVCGLCVPNWKRQFIWNPNKRPEAARAADGIRGHVRTAHKLILPLELATELVSNAKPAPRSPRPTAPPAPPSYPQTPTIAARRLLGGRTRL